ncbi:hypothetical protein F0L74_22120 [Chitinophaga agrisoli]|uniref:Uncharacterized protein n=1 Tax=Chitinophaga agrisoli TaxID=2607653 RepID=A0A5B2VJ28_9BACT|nr:hypothetical protein [Chitinophaga agrisoli]KAA2238914.1 hypothetical protein F0L74_22120 [Chitinophaga agrisoli]
MSTGIDIQLVKAQYAQMSDNELINFVTQDASGLTPQALEAAKAELEKRRLPHPRLSEALEAQNKAYTVSEVDQYCMLVRNLNCPGCNSNATPLNATLTAEVMSFILFTSYKKQVKVGCPTCLDKANNGALLQSLVLGWWGFPFGIIRTIEAIILYIRHKKHNHSELATEQLVNFATANIGLITAHKDNKEALQQIIAVVKP